MTQPGLVARVLTAEDLPALAALRLEGIRLLPHAFLLTEAEALSAPDTALSGWIKIGNAFGLFDDARLVGFAGLRGQSFAMSQHRIHMGPFYVTPEHQGGPAADMLMRQVFDVARARAATQMELWVAEDNTRARAFYARHGFAAVGRLPAAVIHDGTARDDLFMVCDLTAELPAPGPDGIRRLHPGDWRAFRDTRLEMLQEAPEGFGSTHAEWAAKAPDEVMDWLGKIHLWAVVEGGRVVATAGWHRAGGAVTRHRGHVIAVYTTPQARGRRLSRALLDRIADEAREAGIMQLELDVGAENAAAIAAYRAAGYEVTGTIPNCLNHDGYIHDQHFMVRPLTA